jgi:molybdate transport system substrate-binding protein
MTRTAILLVALLLLVPLWPTPSTAGQVKVAVAANFTAPMKEISRRFEQQTGHRTIVSYGSTGKLFAQIHNGAPYEVFLSADQERPRLLFEAGIGDEPTTYAIGQLVLWSADPDLIDDKASVLHASDAFDRIAIANPKTAPYGAAAMQILEALGVREQLMPKLVRGDNIAQTYQFVMTENAQLGFVAMSQVGEHGSKWIPPGSIHTPIRQDMVLLDKGRTNAAAAALVDFLRSDDARAITRRHGYLVD